MVLAPKQGKTRYNVSPLKRNTDESKAKTRIHREIHGVVLFAAASYPLTSIRSNLANILAMFEDTNGSPFSSRTRDIRSSKTSSAIYEPGLTATIYFANLLLFITSGIRETLVRVMLSPSFVNRFHIFVSRHFLKATLPEISIILRNCRSHRAKSEMRLLY